MKDKKIIDQNKADFDEEIETDKGLEAYKKMLAHQREMCERLGIPRSFRSCRSRRSRIDRNGCARCKSRSRAERQCPYAR